MSKWHVGVPHTKFHQQIAPQYCLRAEKLTSHQLEKSSGLFFFCQPPPCIFEAQEGEFVCAKSSFLRQNLFCAVRTKRRAVRNQWFQKHQCFGCYVVGIIILFALCFELRDVSPFPLKYSKLPPIRSRCRPQDGTETDTADLIGEAHHL